MWNGNQSNRLLVFLLFQECVESTYHVTRDTHFDLSNTPLNILHLLHVCVCVRALFLLITTTSSHTSATRFRIAVVMKSSLQLIALRNLLLYIG